MRLLIVTSMFAALLPPAYVVWQGMEAVDHIDEQLAAQAATADRLGRRMESLDDRMLDIERALQRFGTERSQSAREMASNQIEHYRSDLQTLCAPSQQQNQLSPCQLQQENLTLLHSNFAQAEPNQLAMMLRDFRAQQVQLERWVWQTLEQSTHSQISQVERLRNQLTWQAAGAGALTLSWIALATALLLRPVRRLRLRLARIESPLDLTDAAGAKFEPAEFRDINSKFCQISARLKSLEALRHGLLRHASQELKTPLASLKEGCSLLADGIIGSLNPRQREVLGLIDRSIQRLSLLTERLLDYNWILQYRNVRLEPIDTGELIDRVVQPGQGVLSQRKMQLETECAVPVIHSDPDLVTRILTELFGNALAYGEEAGRIHIGIDRKGHETVVEVAHTGPQIEPEHREALFEPFQRGQAARFWGVPGAGLGLAMVMHCAKLLEGRAELTDKEGFDVCARVYLPDREGSTKIDG